MTFSSSTRPEYQNIVYNEYIDRESDTLAGMKQRNSAANFKLPDDCVQIYLAEATKEEHKICQINTSQGSTEELLTAFL